MAEFWRLLLEPQPDRFLAGLLAWLGVAVVTGGVVGGILVTLKRAGIPLLPPQRCRAVTWNGWATLAAFFVMYMAQSICFSVLLQSRFLGLIYGAGILKDLSTSGSGPAHVLAMARLAVWTTVLSFPVVTFLLCVPFVHVVGGKPYQLGWTLHRWRTSLLLGVLAWLLVTPSLYAFYECVTVAYRGLLNGPEEPHGLEVLAKGHPAGWEWAMLIFSAVIAAAVQEELVFRGILLRWASQSFRNADRAVLWVLPWTVMSRSGSLIRLLEGTTPSELALELQAPLFALFMVLLYFSLRTVWRSPPAAGIYASALLFGCAHAQVWPTPVPLFFLGLSLAALAYRTQGLIASIVLHALFNAVACVTLLLG